MTPDTWLRIAAGLVMFLAFGHTVGAVLAAPKHGEPEVGVRAAMKRLRVTEMGITRSYWDFYLGSGWTITALLLSVAGAMWWLAPLVPVQPVLVQPVLVAFALGFAGVTAVSARYFVTAPIIVCGLITVALIMATIGVRAA